MLLNLPIILASNSFYFTYYSFIYSPQINSQAAYNYKLHNTHSIKLFSLPCYAVPKILYS